MAGPAPEVAAVRAAVRTGLADLAPGSRVLVACSGGPDSLALAAATAFVVARAGLLAGAVVVDHGWRDDSAAVAAVAAAACRALGLDPVDVVAVDAGGPGGPEAAARRARYAALDAAADRHSAAAVLLGHTLDDQAETVLLGLARGSGARSLAGMPARRGVYRRPLLDLRRTSTVRACAALGLTPWADPANADPRHQRVRVRAAAAALQEALGPGLAEALARTGALLAEDAEALDVAAAGLLAEAVTAGIRPGAETAGATPAGAAGETAGQAAGQAAGQTGGHNGAPATPPVRLDVPVLAAAPAAVRRRVLLTAARAAGSPAGALSRRHALAVDALVTTWHGQGRVHLPGGVVAQRRSQTLTLSRPE